MKAKSLATQNRYLKQATSGKCIARNAATSTSVETGKPSSKYVTRCSRSGQLAESKNLGSRKKAVS